VATAHANNVRVVRLEGACPINNATNPFGACPGDIYDPNARQLWINSLLTYVQQYGIDGVNLDIEAYPEADLDELVVLVSETYAAFKAWNNVSQVSFDGWCFPSSWPSLNWAVVSQNVDFILNMCYDDEFKIHYKYGDNWANLWPLPESPLANAAMQIDRHGIGLYQIFKVDIAHKLVLGVPWYGLDFTCSFNDTKDKCIDWANFSTGAYPVAGVQIKDVPARLANSISGPHYDSDSDTQVFDYYYNNQRHQVWYDDWSTLSTKYDMAAKAGIKGVGFWTIDAIDPTTSDGKAMFQALKAFPR